MLKSIKIKNFRSIKELEIFFSKTHTNISWFNWAWKTNILQAILFVFGNSIEKFKDVDLLKNDEQNMYIESCFLKNSFEEKVSVWFERGGKKTYFLNLKKKSKNTIKAETEKISFFSRVDMNLFYLWPKNRRDFLNNILFIVYPEYEKKFKEYEKILKNRNKLLKNIFENKSKKNELDIWNVKFIETREKLYEYIFNLVWFYEEQINSIWDIFISKKNNFNFIYKTKVKKNNIKSDIKEYIDKNFERDLILQKTHIWPHVDDFDIEINWKSVLNFASRWELKSIILELKKIELNYIKKESWKTPILLIDDIESELDEKHIDFVCNTFKDYQIISSSINPIKKENIENFYI